MTVQRLHRFQIGGRHFVLDTHNCFCFECDEITGAVLELYPQESVRRIMTLLKDRFPEAEVQEVIGELDYLRVTRSILVPGNDEEWLKIVHQPAEVTCLTLCSSTDGTAALVRDCLPFLLGRSGTQQDLTIILRCTGGGKGLDEEALNTLQYAADAVLSAGKKLSFQLDVPIVTKDLQHPACSFRVHLPIAGVGAIKSVREVLWAQNTLKSRVFLERLEALEGACPLQLIIQPQTASFSDAFKQAVEAGFKNIRLDLPFLWMHQPAHDPDEVAAQLIKAAQDYSAMLLRQENLYFYPVSDLFKAIRDGEPCYRTDPSGFSALAIGEDRQIYPSVDFMTARSFALGDLAAHCMNESIYEQFQQKSTLTCAECVRCWAQGLCGGGYSAVHAARIGDPFRPEEQWCAAQRQWIQHAVALFTPLASLPLSFDPPLSTHKTSAPKIKWGAALKALFTEQILARPLQESDADWRVRWENWNDAAFFLCAETNVQTTTLYDKEMDATHPRSGAQEYVLTDKSGKPCGLLKIAPDPIHHLAHIWLYMHDPASYGKSALHTVLGTLLNQMASVPGIRHLIAYASAREQELMAALEALSFVSAGTQRDALYHRGQYEPLHLFTYRISE